MLKYIPKCKFSQSASGHADANTGTFCGVSIKQDQIDTYLRTFFNASFSKKKTIACVYSSSYANYMVYIVI